MTVVKGIIGGSSESCQDLIVHNRLRRSAGQWYWDGEPIDSVDALHLKGHYDSLKEELSRPWAERNDKYDCTGRLNYHWEDS